MKSLVLIVFFFRTSIFIKLSGATNTTSIDPSEANTATFTIGLISTVEITTTAVTTKGLTSTAKLTTTTVTTKGLTSTNALTSVYKSTTFETTNKPTNEYVISTKIVPTAATITTIIEPSKADIATFTIGLISTTEITTTAITTNGFPSTSEPTTTTVTIKGLTSTDALTSVYTSTTFETTNKPTNEYVISTKIVPNCLKYLFGENCTLRCYCVNQPCNSETGICPPGGCEIGFKGGNCSTECDPGTYGNNCANTCTYCYNNSCDRFEGNCTGGCADMYYGNRCQSRVSFQPCKDPNTNVIVYAVVGTFFITVILLVLSTVAVLRFRRLRCCQKKSYSKETTVYENRVFNDKSNVSDYTDIVPIRNEQQYETLGNVSL